MTRITRRNDKCTKRTAQIFAAKRTSTTKAVQITSAVRLPLGILLNPPMNLMLKHPAAGLPHQASHRPTAAQYCSPTMRITCAGNYLCQKPDAANPLQVDAVVRDLSLINPFCLLKKLTEFPSRILETLLCRFNVRFAS